ncbi:AP endonuclease [Glonium stellatum]|uniref:Apurinic-apyrimidinic endonuclease 1 n=1 Tax=Glonium stellatum TaxID=574774 RepID=A0A8E2JY41_9PEZI|nr:AP endonuclease [Glonium stellatum]
MGRQSSSAVTSANLTEQIETETAIQDKSGSRKRKAESTIQSTKKTKRVSAVAKVSYAEDSSDEAEVTPKATPKKGKKHHEIPVEERSEVEVTITKKVQRKRKTKEDLEAEAMALAARTVGSKLLVGAHVSGAGGVHNSIANCVKIGGNAFAVFLKSQRKWANPALSTEHITLFKAACKTHNITPSNTAVPHGSYLVNLAHTDPARTTQAYDAFVDDLSRCQKLGISLYNFHPGNSASSTREEAIAHIASNLNRAHADPSTGTVITLLETMASLGNTIGGTFEDLASIIALVNDKSRVGVCLDTCHVFAAGYDLRTPETFSATMSAFNKVIGLNYLKALHVNDSKAPLSSHRDLHANIGTGFLGLRAFHNIVNEPRLWGLPMVLETPIDVINADGKKDEDKGIWAREIKLLESLVGMDIDSKEFLELEENLQKQGIKEREKVQDQVERKKVKDTKSKAKGKGKKAKKQESDEEGLSDEE